MQIHLRHNPSSTVARCYLAPGEPLRVLVIDLQPEDPDAEPEVCTAHGGHSHTHQPLKKEPRVFINPEILEESEEHTVYSEGCLSVPEIYADVSRHAQVTVRAQDIDGVWYEVEGTELLGRCLQHEIDHLHGRLFTDRLSLLKRRAAMREWLAAGTETAA